MRDVKQLGRARSRKNIMISSQARFADPSTPKANNPGPGHYGTGMVYGNLLKQVGVQERCVEANPVPCSAYVLTSCKPWCSRNCLVSGTFVEKQNSVRNNYLFYNKNLRGGGMLWYGGSENQSIAGPCCYCLFLRVVPCRRTISLSRSRVPTSSDPFGRGRSRRMCFSEGSWRCVGSSVKGFERPVLLLLPQGDIAPVSKGRGGELFAHV